MNQEWQQHVFPFFFCQKNKIWFCPFTAYEGIINHVYSFKENKGVRENREILYITAEIKTRMKYFFTLLLLLTTLVLKSQNHSALWNEIYKLELNKQYKSANEKVLLLYANAVKQHDDYNIVKTFFYRSKFKQAIQETDEMELFRDLDTDIARTGIPYKYLLLTYKAKLLLKYRTDNGFRIREYDKIKEPYNKAFINQWRTADFDEAVSNIRRQVFADKAYLKTAGEPLGDLVFLDDDAQKLPYSLYELLLFEWLSVSETQNNFGNTDENIPYLKAKDVFNFGDDFTTIVFPEAFRNVVGIYQELEAYYKQTGEKEKLDQIRYKRYQNFIKVLGSSFELQDELLSEVFKAMKTPVFQSKVLLEKVNLWYTYAKKYTKRSDGEKMMQARLNTVKYIKQLNEYPVTEKESAYIEQIYKVITDKKLQTALPGYFVPNKTDKGLVRFANADTLFTRFYRVPDYASFEALSTDSLKKVFIEKHTPAYEFQTELKPDSLYLERKYEYLLNGIEKGYYLTSTSPALNSAGYEYVTLDKAVASTIVLFYKAEAATLDFYFVDRVTGLPLIAKKVKINKRSFTTNKLGVVSVKKSKRTKEEPDTEFLVQVNDGDFVLEELCDFDEEEMVYGYKNTRRWEEGKIMEANFFTDRKLYRPGQQVLFKTLIVDADDDINKREVMANLRVLVTAKDDFQTEIYRKEHVTNAYGSLADSLFIPNRANISRISIRYGKPENLSKKEKALWENFSQINGDTDIFIEEYKRPNYTVTVDEFKDDVGYGGKISIKGRVRTFAKTPVSNAKVEVKVNLEDRAMDYSYLKYKEHYAEIKGSTDATGNFELAFNDKAVKADSLIFKPLHLYRMIIKVTDAAGEVQETYSDAEVNHNDLNLQMDTEREIVKDDDVKVSIKATNANGRKKEVAGRLKIIRYTYDESYVKSRLWPAPDEQEIPRDVFKRHFPDETYVVSDNLPKKKETVFEKQISIDTTGIYSIPKPQWLEKGSYEMVFYPDLRLHADSLKVDFMVRNQQNFDDDALFALQKNDPVLEKGFLKLKYNAQFKGIHVYIQAQQNFEVLPMLNILTEKGTSEIKIPIKELPTEKVFLNYYFVYDNRVYEGVKEYNFLVNPKMDYKTEVVRLRNRLIPGTKEQILLKVHQEDGKAFEGEMMAGLYDMSTEHLLGSSNNWFFFTGYPFYENHFTNLYVDSKINQKWFNNKDWEINLNGKLALVLPRIQTYGLDDNFLEKMNYYERLKRRMLFAEPKPGFIRISGIVTTDFGEPVPGASLTVRGTLTGTETDLDGNFMLYAAPDDIIKIDLPGYIKTQFIAKDFKGYATMVEDDLVELNEVVIDTYSSPTLNEMISLYKGSDKNAQKNFEARIGDTVILFDLTPKEQTTVILRGVGSVTNAVEPMYVMDGIPVSAERFRSLAPEDINSVSLLKDTGATAIYGNRGANGVILISTKRAVPDPADVKIRKNLKETAFFKPFVYPNKAQLYEINYEVPESLTEWKFQALTHNKKAQASYLQVSLFTQKDVTISPNLPRFLREGDEITLRARISNVSDRPQNARALLQFKDAVNENDLDIVIGDVQQEVAVPAGSSAVVSWKLKVPYNILGLQYKVLVQAGDFSDGEQGIIPVLTNTQYITEHIPVLLKPQAEKRYELTALQQPEGKKPLYLNMQLAGGELWSLLQQFSPLLKYQYECTEQLASKYFANQTVLKLLKDHKQLTMLLKDNQNTTQDKWDYDEQLKNILESETPWLKQLLNNNDSRREMAKLFEEENLKAESKNLLQKIKKRQANEGGFGWFSNSYNDSMMTLQLLQTAKLLKEQGITWPSEYNRMLEGALEYADREFLDTKYSKKELSEEMDYLYVRSFFKKEHPLAADHKAAYDELLQKNTKHWLDADLSVKAKAAVAYKQEGNAMVSTEIINQLRETAVTSSEKGMYWKQKTEHVSYWTGEVESQAFVIEAFAKNEAPAPELSDLKNGLLYLSTLNNGRLSTKAMVQVIYASLLNADFSEQELKAEVTDRNHKALTFEKDAALNVLGVYEVKVSGEKVDKAFEEITIRNTGVQTLKGSIIYSYLQDVTSLKALNQKEGFWVEKMYFKELKGSRIPVSESSPMKVGEDIWIRLRFRTSENVPYVYLKDERPAAFEPEFEQGGMRYTENLRYYYKGADASSHFFFDYVPKGEHEVWYRIRVNNSGNFSNGKATVSSMYAPQFHAYSNGGMIHVED